MGLLFTLFPVVIVGVVLGIYSFRRQRLRTAFASLAQTHSGRVANGPWGLFPRLIVPIEGGEVQISCLHGSRNGRSTQTFAWIGSDDYPETSLEIRRKPDRVGVLEKLGRSDATTGNEQFDEAFWLQAEDQDVVREFLDERLRRALLDFAPSSLVRLRVGMLLAYPHGWRSAEMQRSLEVALRQLPRDPRDLERILDVARMAHQRLVQVRKAQAA